MIIESPGEDKYAISKYTKKVSKVLPEGKCPDLRVSPVNLQRILGASKPPG
ncbi:MAG: hypothetical protein ACUVWV_13805 [Thermodesulfobacteriota bacterium]